jgi:hypothetical protein
VNGKGFVSLKALAGKAPSTPSDILDEIRRIYFKTTRQTIQDDLAHAIELLKTLPDEETRQKATVYMEGLAQMRKDWAARSARKGEGHKSKGKGKTRP